MPFIIPIFISHQGCPHACVFCNQNRITGQSRQEARVEAEDIRGTITKWLGRKRKNNNEVQVAFYGGSFTGLSLSRQQELVGAVQPFLSSDQVQRIRLSTRPDYIDPEGVTFLRDNGVEIVELGVQSLDDQVLKAGRRGHSSADVNRAVQVLRDGGMTIGIQLMIGLPKDTTTKMVDTARRTVALRPDFVRIYPVLVLAGSLLAHMYERGTYQPLSLNRAIAATGRLRKIFAQAGISVIRMGVQPSASLENGLLAGPYHPAFGELVQARYMFQQTRKALSQSSEKKVRISINNRDQSIFSGPRRLNIRRLEKLGLGDRFTLTIDPQQPRHTLHILSPTCN